MAGNYWQAGPLGVKYKNCIIIVLTYCAIIFFIALNTAAKVLPVCNRCTTMQYCRNSLPVLSCAAEDPLPPPQMATTATIQRYTLNLVVFMLFGRLNVNGMCTLLGHTRILYIYTVNLSILVYRFHMDLRKVGSTRV